MSTQVDYIAVQKFAIGNPSIDIQKDSPLQFDGHTLCVPNYPPIALPTFRGVIDRGWVIRADRHQHGMSAPAPVSAGITFRPADGGNPMEPKPRMAVQHAQEEEREVHSGGFKHSARPGHIVEAQDGVVVRPLGKAKSKTEVTDASVGQAIRAANSIQIRPGQGKTREEVMSEMDDEQRELYLSQIQAHRSSHVDDDASHQVVAGPDSQGRIVSRVVTAKTSEREGIRTTNSVGGGIGVVDIGGTGEAAAVDVTEHEGIKFTNTNGPGRKKAAGTHPQETDPRRVIARSICSDFPAVYDFDASTRKKIARIQADFEDRPDIIRAVAAAETDTEMRTRLVQEFPSAFGG